MTLPYLPGWGDELAKYLPQLGQGIARLINPNLDRELALQDAITKDPSILQQLTNMESTNPGALESLGFGRVAKTISGMSPSADYQLKEKLNRNAATAISNDPQLAADATSVNLTGKTQAGRKIEESDAKISKNKEIVSNNDVEQIPVFNAKNRAELESINNANKDAQFKETRRGLAKDWLAQNPKKNPREIASMIVKGGQISPDVAAGLMDSNPAIKEAIDRMEFDDRARLEKELVSLRTSENKNDVLERYRAQTAADYLKELDNPNITFDGVYKYLSNPQLQQRAQELLKNPQAAANDQDKELLQIQQAFSGLKGERRSKVTLASIRALTNAQTEARRAYSEATSRGDKPEAIASQLQGSAIAIQTLLEELAPVTGKHIAVKFVDKIPKTENFLGFGGTYGIVFEDQNGNPVDPKKIGQSSKVDMLIQGINEGKTTLDEAKKHPIWETLTKEEQDSITKTAKPSKGKSTTSDSVQVSKSKEPVLKADLTPQVVSQIDTLAPGLSQSDDIKSLAAQDSIEAVNEVYDLAKTYVESGYRKFPTNQLDSRLKRNAFQDAVKYYRAANKK